MSFSTIISMINAKQGAEKIGFSASYMASKETKDLVVDETTYYLYVFEEGIPIVVTYLDTGYVSGQFIFLDDTETLSDIKDVFEQYKSSVHRIDI